MRAARGRRVGGDRAGGLTGVLMGCVQQQGASVI